MRLYVELINQRYDDQGAALGAFGVGEWRTLLERLTKARENCGVETSAEKATSFDTGTGHMTKLPSSVVFLLNGRVEDIGPLVSLRNHVESRGGVLRVLTTGDLSLHVEAVAGTLSGDHGFEKRGVHFRCVAGDDCGLKVYQGDPGYDELVRENAEAKGRWP